MTLEEEIEFLNKIEKQLEDLYIEHCDVMDESNLELMMSNYERVQILKRKLGIIE